MPIAKLEAMPDSAMTTIQNIASSTKSGAEVCHPDKTLGIIEFDKEADNLVVRENLLENLRWLLAVEHATHGGKFIR